MINAQHIYDKSPIFIQNILCSIYGYKIFNRRFQSKYSSFSKLLSESNSWSKEKINTYNNEMFNRIVTHAYNNIPYYKNKFDHHGVVMSQVQNISDIQKLPILSKIDMRELSQSCSHQIRHTTIHTSGSTGTPLAFHVDDEALNFYYALWDRYKRRFGITNKSRKITLGGKMVVPLKQNRPPFWRMNYYSNQLYISTQHLSNNNIPIIIDQIIKFDPEEIFSYPSALNLIAKYTNQIKIPSLKVITVTCENLLPGQRELFEKVFDCPVYQTYGLAEPVTFFTECNDNCLHHNFEFGFYEILDENGHDCSEGEIIVTGFYNKIMPFIRYKTNDIGVRNNTKSCACGQNSDIIKSIDGRIDDYILTPDGNSVGRMSHIFKGEGIDVIESQFIQNTINGLDIYIVPGNSFTNNSEDIIRNNLIERLGTNMSFNFHYVSTIAKTKSGKLRTVISEIKN